jgi:ATP-binding cassette subfamily F protein uup
MDESKKVIEYIRDTAEFIQTVDGTITASQMCERFLFNGSMQYMLISKLSGGEKRRLYLLKILMEAPNVLVLDEPTNDLDIKTLTILEDYLRTFRGIVITVSHDRYFLDKIATRIFAFEENGVLRQYEGNFGDYKAAVADYQQELIQISVSINNSEVNTKQPVDKGIEQKTRTTEKKLKFTYNEQREYDQIDDILAALEQKISEVDTQIAASASEYGKLNDLLAKKDILEQEYEVKMERWVYLNDLNEQINAQKS